MFGEECVLEIQVDCGEVRSIELVMLDGHQYAVEAHHGKLLLVFICFLFSHFRTVCNGPGHVLEEEKPAGQGGQREEEHHCVDLHGLD